MNEFYLRARLYFNILLPGLLSVFILIISATHLKLPGFSSFVPLFTVMAIFYWVIYAPNFFPKWFVFILGVFQDILYGTPLGISSLINVILWTIIFSQRRVLVRETFMVIWGIFIITALIVCLTNWLIYTFMFSEFMFYEAIFMQWALSVTLYPLMHRIFNGVFTLILKYF